jgi:serine/threonine protein kinase
VQCWAGLLDGWLTCVQIEKAIRKVDTAEVTLIALYLATTMSAAHELGYMNRDLKPDNILMDDGFRPVILDWGVATEVADDAPLYDRNVGTAR